MAWFDYGTPKRRHLRRGVWLRVMSLQKHQPDLYIQLAKGMRAHEFMDRVVVKEILEDSQVLLECWSYIPNVVHPDDRQYTVTYHIVNEDPNWCCESDVGRGYRR